MQEFIDQFNNWHEVLDILEKGGMTDYGIYPHIYFPWKHAMDYNDFSHLQQLLQKEPWIMAEAIKNAKSTPFRPLPHDDELQKIKGQFNLGYVNYELAGCGLDPLDFTRGLFICGEIGSGKTYPILRLIDQMLSIPIEQRGFNVIIIQVVKRDADFLIRKSPSLRVIEWPDIRYSMFEAEPWDNQEANMNTSISVFAAVNYLMALTQPILKKAVRLCQDKGAPLTFSNIAGELDTAGSSLAQEGFKVKDSIFKIKARLSEFIDTKAVMDTPAGFKVNEFWAKQDICLNLMDQTNDYIYATLITDLLLTLQRYHELTPSHPARLKTLVVIDECRSVFPAKNDFHGIDPDRLLERFITTARSSGIGRITITQEPQSVTSWLADNSAFFLTFPIAGQSIDYLKSSQNLTEDQLAYIEKLPDKGTGIFRDRRFDRKYLVQVPGSLQITHISKEETMSKMKPLLDLMQSEIDALKRMAELIPVKTYTEDSIEEIRQIIFPETLKILQTIHDRFWLHRTALFKATGINPRKGATSIDWLLNNGLVEEVKCYTSAKKAPSFYPITEKGHDLLQTPKTKRKPTPRLFKHTFYQHKVGLWLKKQGYEPKREYRPAGEDDIFQTRSEDGQPIDYPVRVDVYAEQDGRKVGYEVTLSFKNLILNVYKCFIRLEMDELHIVCETKHDKERAQKKVGAAKELEVIRQHHGQHIHYRQISEFL